MTDRLARLKTELQDWLRRNELDGDLSFWTQSEWGVRNEEYLNEACLVITTEGNLHFLLNYAFDHPKVEALQDLLASFGFWFEMGHSWSIGIFDDEGYDSNQTPTRYADKLSDPRWKQKSELVKAKAGRRCEDCGAMDKRLEVHHCWYRYGLEPWQYPLDALRCLCRECHKARAVVDHDFRCLGADFTGLELTRIRECIQRLFYWYDRSVALAFVDAIGPDDAKLVEAVRGLSACKTEPGAT
jgi:hypothetical protein